MCIVGQYNDGRPKNSEDGGDWHASGDRLRDVGYNDKVRTY